MSHTPDPQALGCDHCRDVVERPNVPHVLRKCSHCGREMRIVEPGEHGKGIRVSKGDSFVIPASWLKLSFNPLKSTGQFSRAGLDWFAKFIFIDGLTGKEATFEQDAAALEQRMDEIVNDSPLVKPLDINNPADSEKVFDALSKHQDKVEFWAGLTGLYLAIARDARRDQDVLRASWANACAERCRMMVLFKEHLEEVVWMGQSAKRLLGALNTWDGNRDNKDEEFWQLTFSEHSYVLSQVFAVPVIFIQEKAFVGGMKLDRNEAKFVDYLFSAESSKEAILIEIKTPVSKLLGGQYRKGIYAPSAELAGAVVQVLAYRAELTRNLQSLTGGAPHSLKAFNPRCVLVIGNAEAQLRDDDARRSFELFRASSEVEVVTYDELFRKVEILAELFRLKRTPAEGHKQA